MILANQINPIRPAVPQPHHYQRLLNVGSRLAWIDVGIYGFIEQLWRHDVETQFSCENEHDDIASVRMTLEAARQLWEVLTYYSSFDAGLERYLAGSTGADAWVWTWHGARSEDRRGRPIPPRFACERITLLLPLRHAQRIGKLMAGTLTENDPSFVSDEQVEEDRRRYQWIQENEPHRIVKRAEL